MSTFVIALILFAVTYVLLFALPKYRAYVALCSAVVFTIWLTFICNDVEYGLLDSILGIDFNVLMMIAGTMGIVTLFIESKMPMLIADVMLSKFKSVKTAIVAMAFLSGIVSAFVDNVATVLMIAPIALAVCKKQNMSPVYPIIAIAVSSNLQGAATLVGDTTSILLGGHLDMTFFDFFVFKGKPGIFFAVELGALVCKPRKPDCENCPLKTLCRAYRSGTQTRYPVLPEKKAKRQERVFVFLIETPQGFCIRRREEGVLKGMNEFPSAVVFDGETSENILNEWGVYAFTEVKRKNYTHIFTHIRWEITCVWVRTDYAPFDSYGLDEIEESVSLPTAFKQCLGILKDEK